MKFVRAIWKLLVGIKDALVLVFMLLFFGVLYVGLSAKPQPVGAGVLAFDLDGSVVEQPSSATFAELAGSSSRLNEYRLRDLIAALDEARDDDRVKAVALDLDGFLGGGQAAMSDLSDAVGRVRTSGKPVIAYAACDDWLNLRIKLAPAVGRRRDAGPGGRTSIIRAVRQVGRDRQRRVGTYKSAVEPAAQHVTRRRRITGIRLSSAQAGAKACSRRGRQPDRRLHARHAGAVDAAGGDLGKAALAAGLVDKLGDRRAFEARLADLGGADDSERGGYSQIKLKSYIADRVDTNPRGPIGVVTIAGTIVDGKGPAGTAAGDSIAEAIERGLRDGGLKALVVRVDSPGGSVIASERIRQAIMAAKDKTRGWCPKGGVAAGAVGCDAGISSSPSRRPSPDRSACWDPAQLQGTLQKLGLGADGIKTTPLSGEPDLLKGPSPEVSRLIQAGVESTYRRFLGIVAEARRKSPAEIDRIAQGRVWDGGTAHQIGLIDGFGGLEEAIAKAAELAKLGDERGVRYLEGSASFKESLLEMIASEERDDDVTACRYPCGIRRAPEMQLMVAIETVDPVRPATTGALPRMRRIQQVSGAPVSASDAGLLDSFAPPPQRSFHVGTGCPCGFRHFVAAINLAPGRCEMLWPARRSRILESSSGSRPVAAARHADGSVDESHF
jgi:protease-4